MASQSSLETVPQLTTLHYRHVFNTNTRQAFNRCMWGADSSGFLQKLELAPPTQWAAYEMRGAIMQTKQAREFCKILPVW